MTFKNIHEYVAVLILFICSSVIFWAATNTLFATISFDFDANTAAVYLVDNITADDLKRTYDSAPATQQKLRIFIMPGHEPNFGGAEYRNIKEREMNVVVAEKLAEFLGEHGRYETVIGRDGKDWHPALGAYFKTDEDEIRAWKDSHQEVMDDLVSEGSFLLSEDPVPHQAATKDVALRLYGINKWIGENDFDLAIHIHFNDYGSRRRGNPGQYSGFVIYVPDGQYSNASAAKTVAGFVRNRLSTFVAESDTPKERGGIVEDQELIALGSNNTADVPSLLIEYGYIYESQFQNRKVSDILLGEYAYQTFLGIEDFFNQDERTFAYKTSVLPYSWNQNLSKGSSQSADVLALQFTLLADKLYPPPGKDFRSCPVSGIFGDCTASALKEFQEKNGIEGDGTVIGSKTRALLNSLFGSE